MASAEQQALRLTACLLALVLGACSTSGARQPQRDGSATSSASTIDGQDVLASSGLTVVETYAAASGKQCRRLADASGQIVGQVSCRHSTGDWTLGRALSSMGPELSNGTATVKPDAAAARPMASAVDLAAAFSDDTGASRRPDVVSGKLGVNETLWAFADRMTGNPLNWTDIARINGIADAADVRAGSVLNVPGAVALANGSDDVQH